MFKLQNELVFWSKGGNSIPRCWIILCQKYFKMISKGCLYNIASVKDLESEAPSIELVPLVKNFLEIFPMTYHKLFPKGK